MGTTTTAAYVDDDEVIIAHVGDSRAYLLRDGELIRLTKDHSLVGELVARGKLTEEQAEQHPQRSVITRALGPEADVEVDIDIFPAKAGDLFLLCSDGLTSMVHEPKLRPLFDDVDSLETLGKRLIDAANEAGGRDNITVILFRLADEGEAEAEAESQATMVAGQADSLRTEDVQAAVAAASDRDPEQASDATMVFDDAQKRQVREAAARPPARHRRGPGLRRWVTVAVVTLVIGAVLVGFWVGSRQFYFVGTDDRGLVALYRGLPYELPLGIELWESEYATGVPARLLPESRRDRVLDHRLRSKGDAVDLINQVERGELEE
jgi:protein phosphatase